MSLSLVSNPYLDDSSAKIRQKPVPWEVCTFIFTERPAADPGCCMSAGVPTRRTRNVGGARADQESRQATEGESGEFVAGRWTVVRVVVPEVVEEAAAGGYTAAIACAHCGCSEWCALSLLLHSPVMVLTFPLATRS